MTIQNVVNKNLCLGCGICSYDSRVKGMTYSVEKGMNIPVLSKKNNYKIANQICPGKGYSIIEDSKTLYRANKYSVELGFYHRLYAAHSNSANVLNNASSGGVMTEFLIYLLDNKVVDRVAVTKFIYTDEGPKTITFLTNDINEILNSQGSKYCPVDISNVIQELRLENSQIAYLGTPCQIAGIRQIQKNNPELKEKIVLTISNFCGGFKSYKQINKISSRHNIDFKNITYLRYRGGGQPGGMVIDDKYKNHFEASYKKYGGFTGYSKLLRCHFCVDATGELADISFGDAWLDKYLNDTFPWSIVLTRTKEASMIIEEMKMNNRIAIELVTEEQVCLSQRQNLESKKLRQYSRCKLYKILGYTLPVFDGGYYSTPTPLKTELAVFIIHKIKYLIEKIGLYKYFRILIMKEY